MNNRIDLAVANLIEAAVRVAQATNDDGVAVQVLMAAHTAANLMTMRRAVGNQRYLAQLIGERS